MSQGEILVEIARAVGRIEADVGTLKTDVAALKAVPGQHRKWWLGLLAGFLIAGCSIVGKALIGP